MKDEELNILITGACGVTSRSIVRSLELSPIFKNCNFIGIDICHNTYGLYEGLYKRIYRVPFVSEKNYKPVIDRIIQTENIHAAIIIPEPEVLYWAKNDFAVKHLSLPIKFAEIALSKRLVHEKLSNTGLVPSFQIIKRGDLEDIKIKLQYPFWVRDYSEGTTSGKGSFMPLNFNQLKAWIDINEEIDNFIISEYLPGRNYGCFLLYNKGKLIKSGVAERIEYFMGKVSVSGITGNTAKGKLLNNKEILNTSQEAVNTIIKYTKEEMSGLVVVDIKENEKGFPIVTEINIRHVAFTSSFANAGQNFAEYQLLCALGREDEITKNQEIDYNMNNLILRDIDGLPIYVAEHKNLKIGDYIESK